MCVQTVNIVVLFVPQDSTAGPFARLEMTGMSPRHYFHIHCSKATLTGRQLSHRLLFRALTICTESAATKASQACQVFSRPFRRALLSSDPAEPREYGAVFLNTIYFTALISEAWRDELKELAARVHMSSQAHGDKNQVQLMLVWCSPRRLKRAIVFKRPCKHCDKWHHCETLLIGLKMCISCRWQN